MVCKKLGIDISYQLSQFTISGLKKNKAKKVNLTQRKARIKLFTMRANKCSVLFGKMRYAKVMNIGLVTGALYGTDVSPICENQLKQMKIQILKSEA